MIYKILKRQKAKTGLTAALVDRIKIFYAAGDLTDNQYTELMKQEVP